MCVCEDGSLKNDPRRTWSRFKHSMYLTCGGSSTTRTGSTAGGAADDDEEDEDGISVFLFDIMS